eukprot:jgi/Botrbrau1/10633/Bobra.154_1s0022.1
MRSRTKLAGCKGGRGSTQARSPNPRRGGQPEGSSPFHRHINAPFSGLQAVQLCPQYIVTVALIVAWMAGWLNAASAARAGNITSCPD